MAACGPMEVSDGVGSKRRLPPGEQRAGSAGGAYRASLVLLCSESGCRHEQALAAAQVRCVSTENGCEDRVFDDGPDHRDLVGARCVELPEGRIEVTGAVSIRDD